MPDENQNNQLKQQFNEEPKPQDERPLVDLSGYVVLPLALKQGLPQWWVNDVLITLGLTESQLIILEPKQGTINRDQAILIAESGSKCELSNNVLTLPLDFAMSDNKKLLWAHLKALVK